MKKIEFEANLLFTNKGARVRAVDPVDKTSTPIENIISEKLTPELNYLGSQKLEAYAPWCNEKLKTSFGSRFILSPHVSKFGDGSIDEQMKYVKKYRITIEEIP